MPSPFTLRLWGVRGSIPSPGPLTARYGGNTPCISIEVGEEKCLVIDAGTGVRALGNYLLDKPCQIYVLLTHEHWDHIQGFPFFAPLYQEGRRLLLFPVERDMDRLCSLVDQMDGAHFPVTHSQLPSRPECIQSDPMEFLDKEGFGISRHRTNHPGVCFGYRLDHKGKSIVFMPDNELRPLEKQLTTMEELANFCRGVDVLMHDSQFVPRDFPLKRGWGHSLFGQACELAAMAEAKHLILIHHDPERSDAQLDAIEEESKAWMAKHSPGTQVSVGYEGMTIEF
jgi:phosphoribosyl 1,2-cyclic phosphodiesterase